MMYGVEIIMIRRDALKTELVHRIEAAETYSHDLSERWPAALRAARMGIPRPPTAPRTVNS